MTEQDKLHLLVEKLNRKFPNGEFIFLPMYSYDKTKVSGTICWSWKAAMYNIEYELVKDCRILLEKISGMAWDAI